MTTDPTPSENVVPVSHLPGKDTPQEPSATSTTGRNVRANKRPEKALWRGSRLAAKRTEEAHLNPPENSWSKFEAPEPQTQTFPTTNTSSRDETSRCTGVETSPVQDKPTKQGPHRISFWWAPPPTSNLNPRAPASASVNEAPNQDSSPKQEPIVSTDDAASKALNELTLLPSEPEVESAVAPP